MHILLKTTLSETVSEYEVEAITYDITTMTLYCLGGEYVEVNVKTIACFLILS